MSSSPDDAERRHRTKLAAAGALLLLLGGASAIGWRFEIEARGWASTAWIKYFHFAFPIAMAAFVVWALCVARFVHRLSATRVAVLAIGLSAIATVGLFAIPEVLHAVWGGWNGGPLSIHLAVTPMLAKELPEFFGGSGERPLFMLLQDLVYWFVWMAPTCAIWVLLRALGIRSRLWSVPLSGLVQLWAWPAACWTLAILQHKGGSDPANAVKSGFLIPFLVVAIGLPFLAVPSPARE